MTRFLLAPLALLLAIPTLQAQDDLRRVVLINGDVYVGVVEDETSDPVTIRTTDGIERRFAQAEIDFIAPLIRGRFFRTDPVKTRLFLAPTARTLGGGEFRGDLTYIFPSVTAGLSDRVDLVASGLLGGGSGGGSSVFFSPLVGLKGQVYATESAQVALGLSAQVALGGGDSGFSALPYGVVTLGDETRAVSFGLGGAIGGFSSEVEVAEAIVYGLGVETQINNGVKLFVEALGTIGIGSETEECFQDTFGGRTCFTTDEPLGNGLLVLPGVRFFGDRFAFDVIGFIATDFDTLVGFAPVGARASYSF
ncbi:MAG: hypothetical protein AAGI91_17760 [Bacteroidota bacterium]